MEKPNNLLEMLDRTVKQYETKEALMYKEKGSYVSISYGELWLRIKHFANGLLSLGIKANDKVAIIANSGPLWTIADFAIASIGAVSVPVYPTLPAERIDYILNKTETTAVIVEDKEQLDKIKEIKSSIEPIIIGRLKGITLRNKEHSFIHVERIGRDERDDAWESTWRNFKRDRLLTIISTSGTTGNPKGAMLTHGNILSNIEGVHPWLVELLPEDISLSYLPVSHVFERLAGHYLPLAVGVTIAYAESIDTIPENLKEVRPTIFTSVPRLFEKVYTRVREQISHGSSLKQKIFNWAVKVGEERYEYYLNAEMDDLIRQQYLPRKFARKWHIADRLVYSQVKEQLGGRLRGAVSGGGTLNPEIARFFWALDIPIFEGYGLTETSPIISVNPMVCGKVGTVGKVLPNLDVKLSEEGEILVRGPSITQGYYNDPEETEEAFSGEWFRTGDIGEVDEDGYLKIIDRKKRILVLSTGMNVAPQPIENAINESPYISQSLVIGENRNYVICIVNPEYETLIEWAKKEAIKTSNPEKLCDHPKIIQLLEGEVTKATKKFTNYAQPKKVIIASEEWTIEGGELTPKLSLRANLVEEKYAAEIEAIYDEGKQEVS